MRKGFTSTLSYMIRLDSIKQPRLYTSHRALTERWIHPRYSQRRSRTTEASKTKAEVRVHGQRSGTVRSMSAKILFAKIYSHKGSTMSLFQNAMGVFQTIYTVFLLIPNLVRLINILIKYRMNETSINPWNVQRWNVSLVQYYSRSSDLVMWLSCLCVI